MRMRNFTSWQNLAQCFSQHSHAFAKAGPVSSLWHERMGHLNFCILQLMSSLKMVHGISSLSSLMVFAKDTFWASITERGWISESHGVRQYPCKLFTMMSADRWTSLLFHMQNVYQLSLMFKLNSRCIWSIFWSISSVWRACPPPTPTPETHSR